jgi:hypothetical protein
MLKSYSFGPLAHLVERIHGMDEVSGSSPLGSTILHLTVKCLRRKLADAS